MHKLKPMTLYCNRKIIDTYVFPYIGNMKLKDINTARIDKLFNKLYRNRRKRETYRLRNPELIPEGTRRPVSKKSGVNLNTVKSCVDGIPVLKDTAQRLADAIGRKLGDAFIQEEAGGGLDVGTIKRIRTALSPIFSTAVKKELLKKNPVTHATTPGSEPKEKEFLDAGQCRELLGFLHEMTNPQLPRAIELLLYTGLRVGECKQLGLSRDSLSLRDYSVNHYRDYSVNHYTVEVTYLHDLYAKELATWQDKMNSLEYKTYQETRPYTQVKKLPVYESWFDNGELHHVLKEAGEFETVQKTVTLRRPVGAAPQRPHLKSTAEEIYTPSSLDLIDKALETVSALRSYFGASQNRLEHAYANNGNAAENLQAAEAKIRDTDMAEEAVSYSLHNVLEQAGNAMLAQANQMNQGILSLLQ